MGHVSQLGGRLLAISAAVLLCWVADANASGQLPGSYRLLGPASTAPSYPGVLIAQADADDAYDPFADYSEFEESMDEEEDINFFRNGRLLTLGFIGGYRGWTGVLGEIYTSSPTFGVFMSYFFDLRFALQFGILISDHAMVINLPDETIQGNTSINDISFMLKYYFNTQNVTRGLADLNPYVVGGFSQVYRTFTVSGYNEFSKDSAFGFDIGGGIEIPMMKNKMFFGIQAMYQLVNFADENKEVMDSRDRPTGVFPRGDSFHILGVLGVNF